MKITVEYDDLFEALEGLLAYKVNLHVEEFRTYLRQQWKYAETPDDIDKIYGKFFELFPTD